MRAVRRSYFRARARQSILYTAYSWNIRLYRVLRRRVWNGSVRRPVCPILVVREGSNIVPSTPNLPMVAQVCEATCSLRKYGRTTEEILRSLDCSQPQFCICISAPNYELRSTDYAEFAHYRRQLSIYAGHLTGLGKVVASWLVVPFDDV